MKGEHIACASNVVPSGRITRSKAAASNADVKILHQKPPLPKPNMKQQLSKKERGENSYAAPTAASQCKKRAALEDITNICFNSAKGCVNVTKSQVKAFKRLKPCNSNAKLSSKHSGEKINNLASDTYVESTLVPENKMDEQLPELGVLGSQESIISSDVKDTVSSLDQEIFQNVAVPFDQYNLQREHGFSCQTINANFCKDHSDSSCLEIVDIDSEHTNPLMCSSYSCEISNHLRAVELLIRPYYKFMESVQRDINPSMRSILIDWLVEVSDEYRLVPDTLYLTVNFMDRYLSESCIERQRLQLLGITCMLIASKYEEICAPPIEEFCSITDNTYTRAEVIKMEADILKLLRFQLSVPTVKTFLRRFIRAANALYRVPPPALSHLANYLAELALVEYDFLKYLPSVIAASSIFLARWTIDQFDHPWNKTLEHYTSYKTSQLKPTIIALQDLQTNKSNCPLIAIREKYKQSKYMSVAFMISPDLQPSLF